VTSNISKTKTTLLKMS